MRNRGGRPSDTGSRHLGARVWKTPRPGASHGIAAAETPGMGSRHLGAPYGDGAPRAAGPSAVRAVDTDEDGREAYAVRLPTFVVVADAV